MRATLLAVLACFSAVGLGGSSKTFSPGRNDFTTVTHVGKVRVFLDVRKVDGRRQLQRVKIWVNDKPLEMPANVDLRVPEPKIKRVTLVSTASFTCFSDEPCVDDSPAMLFITYGKKLKRERDAPDPVSGTMPCDESFMSIHIYEEQFGAIRQFVCNESGEEVRVLFEPR